MLNKKLELNLGGEKVQVWFNNYAVFELQKLYGIEQGEIMKKVSERAMENYLLLITDLVKVGIKGHCLAKGENTPRVYDNLSEHVATADMGELMNVWEVFFNMMGGDIKKEETPKKKVMKEQSPQPVTKMS